MSKKPKIEFDAKGLPVVYGDDDQPVSADDRPIEEIIGKGKVVKVENITIMQVKGSCYRIVIINGKSYIIPC